MRGKSAVVAFGLALSLVAQLHPTAGTADDVGCASFMTQEDAQAVLTANPDDRFGLDPDGDGIACNALPSRGGTPAATPEPATMAAVVFPDPTAADVDRFWRRAFTKAKRAYASPAAVVAVDEQTTTPCGFVFPFPAFYCPVDGAVYYDTASFAAQDDDGYGHAVWVIMLAHEWGHHAQDLLGLLDDHRGTADPTAFSMATELQAQCAAGAYVRDALRRHHLRRIEADRADLVAHTFLGDGLHGTSSLLVDSFERGRAKGLAGCGFDL